MSRVTAVGRGAPCGGVDGRDGVVDLPERSLAVSSADETPFGMCSPASSYLLTLTSLTLTSLTLTTCKARARLYPEAPRQQDSLVTAPEEAPRDVTTALTTRTTLMTPTGLPPCRASRPSRRAAGSEWVWRVSRQCQGSMEQHEKWIGAHANRGVRVAV